MILIVDQVYIFLYAILGGAIVAFLYDVLRIKRRAIRTGVIMVSLEDILYWFVAAIFLFITVYNSNSGEMRGYILIGNVIGVILYESIFSRIIIASSVRVINFTKRILIFVLKIMSYPFRLIFKLLIVPISFILKQIFKPVREFVKMVNSIRKKAYVLIKKGIKRMATINKKIRNNRKSA